MKRQLILWKSSFETNGLVTPKAERALLAAHLYAKSTYYLERISTDITNKTLEHHRGLFKSKSPCGKINLPKSVGVEGGNRKSRKNRFEHVTKQMVVKSLTSNESDEFNIVVVNQGNKAKKEKKLNLN